MEKVDPYGHHASHTQLDSGIVTNKRALLCCIIVSVAANADYVEVYNGHDAVSGTKICKLKALLNRSVAFNITHGVLCTKGIYVSCSVSTVEWSVFYHTVPLPPEKQ